MKTTFEKDFYKSIEFDKPILDAIRKTLEDKQPRTIENHIAEIYFVRYGEWTGGLKDKLLPVQVYAVTGIQGFRILKEAK